MRCLWILALASLLAVAFFPPPAQALEDDDAHERDLQSNPSAYNNRPIKAVATFKAGVKLNESMGIQRVTGTVTFTQKNSKSEMYISVNLKNLDYQPNSWFIQVVPFTTYCQNPNLGPIWSPLLNAPVGDLTKKFGPLAGAHTTIKKTYTNTDSRLTLYGQNSIIGASLVIYANGLSGAAPVTVKCAPRGTQVISCDASGPVMACATIKDKRSMCGARATFPSDVPFQSLVQFAQLKNSKDADTHVFFGAQNLTAPQDSVIAVGAAPCPNPGDQYLYSFPILVPIDNPFAVKFAMPGVPICTKKGQKTVTGKSLVLNTRSNFYCADIYQTGKAAPPFQ